MKETKEEKEDKKESKKHTEIDLLKKENKLWIEKFNESEDKFLRFQAEFQNYKRRKEEDTEKIIKYSNEELIKQLLPILDSFERAIILDDNDLTDEISKFLEGFKMIYCSFTNILTSFGVEEIEALDKTFDPNFHQAVLTDSDSNKEEDIILEVLQKGYKLNGRILRPTMVKVNKL